MKPPPDPHYRHRFSAEIISHAVWLYHVFSLSLDFSYVRSDCTPISAFESIINVLQEAGPRPE